MTTKPETIRISASHREEIQAQASVAAIHTAHEKALDLALGKADASAHKVADSLGVRLLGIHDVTKNVLEVATPAGAAPNSQVIEASVDVEYRVSGYSQARLDLRIIRDTHNLVALLKKELSTRWFTYSFGRFGRAPQKANALNSAPTSERALVVGHFSFPGGGGTFGDIEAQEVVCSWLSEAGIGFDVASNIEDGVDGIKLDQVDESKYGIFIFVCGPWYPHRRIPALLLKKFAHCLKIGVNLTTYEAGTSGFDYLLARDNPDEVQADISFANKVNLLPVVGVVLVERQAVYGRRQRHLYVRQIIREYLEAGEVVPVWLDTIAHNNKAGLNNGQQFESLIHKMDLVITNRLHGTVLSLKNAVPVIAIDAVAGGGKVTAQAKALGWPLVIPSESLSVETLRASVEHCLNTDTRPDLQRIQQQAISSVQHTKDRFLNILEKRKPV